MSNFTTAEVSVLVTAPDLTDATHDLTSMLSTLGSVWIIEGAQVFRHEGTGIRGGVCRLGVKVTGPSHEVHEGAPIIAQALASLRCPHDTLRVA